MTPKQFKERAIAIAEASKDGSLWDAILHIQEQYALETETVSKLVTGAFKKALLLELANKRLLKDHGLKCETSTDNL